MQSFMTDDITLLCSIKSELFYASFPFANYFETFTFFMDKEQNRTDNTGRRCW